MSVILIPTGDYIADWNGRLLKKLYRQFQGKPNWIKWCALLARQAQDLEDQIESLRGVTSIANMQGVWLDVIGRILGQKRLESGDGSDPTYRLFLAARRAANKSGGDPESIYAVFSALYPGADMVYIPGFAPGVGTPGQESFELRILTPLSDAQAQAGPSFLFDSEDAGVRGIFEWQEFADDTTFMTANCTTLTAPASSGATTLTVDSRFLGGFPSTGGNLVLDRGLTNHESVAYTLITGGNTLHLSAALTQNHLVNAEVDLDETVGAGLGWGDATDPTQGGDWSGAVQG